MPTKGMRSIFFRASPAHSHSSSVTSSPPHHQHQHHTTFSESLMEENLENAELLITQWDQPPSSIKSDSALFSDDRREARAYLQSIKHLQTAMQFFLVGNSSSEKLVRAQNLMQIAMKRLQKEFYQILSSNRDYLDAESVSTHSSSCASVTTRSFTSDDEGDSEDDITKAGESISELERNSELVMSDLKWIADCMIGSGYGKECVKIYQIIRKSIIDEGLHHLGVERLPFANYQKMDWESLEMKIRSWLNAMRVAVKTLFYGERILCDYVFSSSANIAEACFSEISKEAAKTLFEFPELVAKTRKSPEKMFRVLDMYEVVSELSPEIESIFSFESTSAVRSQAVDSIAKLGESVRAMLTDFESAITKDISKTAVPGGGVHPLTRYVMNYISFLADYSDAVTDIVADWPLHVTGTEVDEAYTSVISARLAWLVLVLLCKLDGKAELYKDVALSYLFLSNNLQYVVAKVRKSNLKYILGDDWITKHQHKLNQYAANYERMGWGKVLSSLPEYPTAEISPANAEIEFQKFNAAFEEAYRKQSTWTVPDSKLRDEIKISISKKLMPKYREFYERNRDKVKGLKAGAGGMNGLECVVRFVPDDLDNYLSDLFYGNGVSGSTTSSVSSSPSSSHSLGRRFLGLTRGN